MRASAKLLAGTFTGARACVMLRAMDSPSSKMSSWFAAFRASRSTYATAVVSIALGSAAIACEPPRVLINDSSTPDAMEPMDSGVEEDSAVTDTGVDTGVRRDAAADAHDANADVPGCDVDRCDESCVAMGARVGRCMMNVCNCVPYSTDGSTMTDATSDSARADVVLESSIRGCTTNAECPPSMFCSAASCDGPGSCLLRQESDPNRCLPDPMPSCGCDGLLYPSACARTAVGVRQDAMRRCTGDAAVLPMSDASSSGG